MTNPLSQTGADGRRMN